MVVLGIEGLLRLFGGGIVTCCACLWVLTNHLHLHTWLLVFTDDK